MSISVKFAMNSVYLLVTYFRFVNSSDQNETVATNMFNVPEVDSSTVKKIMPKTSTSKPVSINKDKKTVKIHTLTSKVNKIKVTG